MGVSSFGMLLFLLGLFTMLPDCVTSYSYTGERAIRQSVLNSVTHDRMARPADATNATVGFTLLVINDLNILSQDLEISGWFTVLWEDERLTWDPQGYDDTSYIHALEEEIWKPEVLIANAQSNLGLISDDHLIYRINYMGHVEWEPVISSVTHCVIDVTYYPFDTQTCTMKLLSWGLPSNELMLLKLWDEVNMQSFLGSAVWSVLETSVTNSLVTETIQNVTESYSQLEFTFVLKRNPGKYVINTLFPIVVSSFVMAFVHLVPLQSGERVTAAFLTLVMDSILFMTFTSHIPDIETTTSLLGIFVTFGFCLDVLWVVTSIFLARVHHQPPERPVPRVTKTIIWALKFITLYSDVPPPKPKPKKSTPEEPTQTVKVPTDDLVKVSREVYCEEGRRVDIPKGTKKNSVNPEVFTEHVKTKHTALPSISNGLPRHKLIDHPDYNGTSKSIGQDSLNMSWIVVAAVIDRVLFLVFLLLKLALNISFVMMTMHN